MGERARVKPPMIIDHESGASYDSPSAEADEDEDAHLTGSKHRGKKNKRHMSLVEDSTNAIVDVMRDKWDKDAAEVAAQSKKDEEREAKADAVRDRLEQRQERMLEILASMNQALWSRQGQ